MGTETKGTWDPSENEGTSPQGTGGGGVRGVVLRSVPGTLGEG